MARTKFSHSLRSAPIRRRKSSHKERDKKEKKEHHKRPEKVVKKYEKREKKKPCDIHLESNFQVRKLCSGKLGSLYDSFGRPARFIALKLENTGDCVVTVTYLSTCETTPQLAAVVEPGTTTILTFQDVFHVYYQCQSDECGCHDKKPPLEKRARQPKTRHHEDDISFNQCFPPPPPVGVPHHPVNTHAVTKRTKICQFCVSLDVRLPGLSDCNERKECHNNERKECRSY